MHILPQQLRFQSTDLDTAVKPGSDFYLYGVGSWLKNNPIPDDYSRWGIFEMVTEYTNQTLRTLLENPAPFKGTPDERLAKLVTDFYAVGMDEALAERIGWQPLQPLFTAIEKIVSPADVALVVGQIHRQISRPLFFFASTPDARQSDQTIAGLAQGGLGLPERDYYLATDERSIKIREQYVTFLAHLLGLAGLDEGASQAAAETVLSFETSLAKISTSKEDLRDPVKNYHKMPVSEVKQLCPGFDWLTYFSTIGRSDPGPTDVGQLEFFKGLSDILQITPLPDLKIYLRAAVLRNAAPYLSASFADEHFNFFGKILNGQKAQKPRWKKMVDATDDWLGKALGKLYVRDNFSPIAKERIKQLVDNLIQAMAERIKRLTWMGEATKQEALRKLSTIMVKVAYPDNWYSYDALTVERDSLIKNVIRAHEFEFNRDIDKIGLPVDRTEWLMHPQTVNAYFEPTKNEIVFPAGILQAPFFDDAVDDALNYGGIGSVIGHEITHAFDDQGRQFDAKGNLHDWWTKEDETRFKERAQQLVEQYNGYSPLPGIFVNGQFTLGENIADLGGLQIAWDAFQMTSEAKANELVDGFTPAQRFFLSYSQVWKTNIREEKARLYVMVDPHSPAHFRTNGPLSNIPSFFAAFGVQSSEPMYRPEDKRVIIW